jgi:tetratricopeptide (TPR) repeat protein
VRRIGIPGVTFCWIIFALAGLARSQQQAQFESLLASAQQAQARGDFDTAADQYRKAAFLHPEMAELRANLGLMYFQTGKNEQAAEAFLQAIRLKPDLFVPNLFLGLDYVKSKHFKGAIPYLKRAALLKPTDIQIQLGLGEAYTGCGNIRLAIRSYMQAAQLDPTNANTWYKLGVNYLKQVESDARTLFAQYRDSGYLLALEAETLAQQRAFVQAEPMYKRALESREFPPGTHAGYAFVLLHRHDLPGAEHELNSELAATPGSPLAKLGLARLRVEQGATEEGVNELQAIGKTDAGFLRANASIFDGELSAIQRSELQRVLQARRTAGDISLEVFSLFRGNGSSEQHTDLPTDSALFTEGPVRADDPARLYQSGDYRDAFDKGAELAVKPSTQAQGLYWETRSAEKLAVISLARASEVDSSSPKLHVLLGDLYRQRESFQDAEQEYRKALALQRADTGALFGLCLALLGDHQMDEAYGLAQAAVKENPDDPELNAVMGEILCGRDDFAAAEPYLRKSLKTKPEYIPRVHELLAEAYAKTNRTLQAIAELKLAIADDKDGRLHYQIARLYLQIGDRKSAKQALEESKRIQSEGLTGARVLIQQAERDGDSH